MRSYFLLALALGLLLTSCSTERYYQRYQRQHPELVARAAMLRSVHASGITDARLLDSIYAKRAVARPLPTERDPKAARVLERWHRQFERDARRYTHAGPVEASLPKKCKGCTIVYGDATVAGKKAQVAAGAGATASVIEKKAGPAVVASDSTTLNSLAGGGNLASTQGNNNATSQTKQDTTREAPGVGATIAQALTGPLGWMVALGAVGGLGYVILLWRRRRTPLA